MKAELKTAEEVTHIFFILSSKYASFLDYNIFDAILKRFGENEQHDDLNYPAYLKSFFENHTIQEFIKSNPKLINPKLKEELDKQSEKITIKFNVRRTQSLSTLNEVKEEVAKILGVKPEAVRLVDVRKGCVLVTLLIHTSIANAIFTHEMEFTEDQKDRFRAASVLWLKYKGHKFDFGKPNNQDQVYKSDSGNAFM